jgi:hypothetical protein
MGRISLLQVVCGRKGSTNQADHQDLRGPSLKMVEKPQHTIRHRVEKCEKCGRSLKEKEATDLERRPVFEVPPAKM